MYMIKISIVIPIFNGAMYLHECLDSILQQTLEEIEIICVDDASNDLTPDILEKYSSISNKIKIITNKTNCGAGVSRNNGLKIAQGKYVAFLDADDVFEHDMLQNIFCQSEKYLADVCTFNEDEFIDNIQISKLYPYPYTCWTKLEKMGVFSSKDVKDVLFNTWNGWPWDKLFRREFLLENKIYFQEIRSSEDGLFVHSALAMAKRITCLNKVLVHHRINISSSLSNSRDNSWECCYFYLRELKKYLIEHNQYTDYEKSFINWVPNFLYWNYWTLNEENRKKLYDVLKKQLIDEFDLLKYRYHDFYNGFYYWFIHEIHDSENYDSCKIPVDITGRWFWMFKQNKEKVEILFQYLKEHQYKAALWGAGERCKIFLREYENREELQKVYDEDKSLKGKKLGSRFLIELFNNETCKGIDFIIVINKLYFGEITTKVKSLNSHIHVFDFEKYQEPYLSFPLSLEDCIM